MKKWGSSLRMTMRITRLRSILGGPSIEMADSLQSYWSTSMQETCSGGRLWLSRLTRWRRKLPIKLSMTKKFGVNMPHSKRRLYWCHWCMLKMRLTVRKGSIFGSKWTEKFKRKRQKFTRKELVKLFKMVSNMLRIITVSWLGSADILTEMQFWAERLRLKKKNTLRLPTLGVSE